MTYEELRHAAIILRAETCRLIIAGMLISSSGTPKSRLRCLAKGLVYSDRQALRFSAIDTQKSIQ